MSLTGVAESNWIVGVRPGGIAPSVTTKCVLNMRMVPVYSAMSMSGVGLAGTAFSPTTRRLRRIHSARLALMFWQMTLSGALRRLRVAALAAMRCVGTRTRVRAGT